MEESKQTDERKPRRLIKWLVFGPVIVGTIVMGLFMVAIPYVGGSFDDDPHAWESGLSVSARKLVDDAYRPYGDGELVDVHTHIVGLGAGDSGARVNEEMLSWFYPIKRAKFEIYVSAAGVSGLENADIEYVDRLVNVASAVPKPSRHYIMAFDGNYSSDGKPNLELTEFYVPNDYVFQLSEKHPDLFTPVVSVHPYRSDAIEQLEALHKRGARFIKWLPNAMGIDPADPKIDAYYDTVRRLGFVIISHAGEEQAVDSADAQKLGNPLKLRRGLDRGVKFVVAHFASLGEMEDYDDPDGGKKPAFELLLRMMENPAYDQQLFADISAIAQFNRVGPPLMTVLKRRDLHPRLVNGSDYPLPAINALIHLDPLVDDGLLTVNEEASLAEIYRKNPLLFDFVLKRTLKHPDTGEGFAESVFMMPEALKD